MARDDDHIISGPGLEHTLRDVGPCGSDLCSFLLLLVPRMHIHNGIFLNAQNDKQTDVYEFMLLSNVLSPKY